MIKKRFNSLCSSLSHDWKYDKDDFFFSVFTKLFVAFLILGGVGGLVVAVITAPEISLPILAGTGFITSLITLLVKHGNTLNS